MEWWPLDGERENATIRFIVRILEESERRSRRKKKLSPLSADVEPETNKICPLPDGKTSIYGSAMLNIHYPDWLHDMSHLGEVQCKLMNASDQVILAPVPLSYSALRTKFQLTHTHTRTNKRSVLCSFFSFASYRPCHSYRILKWLLAFLARFGTVNEARSVLEENSTICYRFKK